MHGIIFSLKAFFSARRKLQLKKKVSQNRTKLQQQTRVLKKEQEKGYDKGKDEGEGKGMMIWKGIEQEYAPVWGCAPPLTNKI